MLLKKAVLWLLLCNVVTFTLGKLQLVQPISKNGGGGGFEKG